MLRSQIIAAVDHLHAVLIETGVQSTIRGAFDVGRRDKKDDDAVLSTFAKFYSEYLRLNEYEHEVLRIFDLQALGSSEFWKLLLAEDVHIPPVSNIYQGLFYLDKYVPRIINLLRRRTDVAGDAVDIEPVPGAMETIITAKKTLTVIVPESDDRLSSPERLSLCRKASQF